MSDDEVRTAYAARSAEYTAVLGAVEASPERDRDLIAHWADRLSGPVVDAGCGPGHWTAFLHARGVAVEGVDLVPEFVQGARRRFPEASFRIGSLREPGVADGTLGGVLAWYSLIHLPPGDLDDVLAGFAAGLRPGGSLLIGFFEGPLVEQFAHAVSPAWFHPLESMRERVERAGLRVVHQERRSSPGVRDHGELIAVRS